MTSLPPRSQIWKKVFLVLLAGVLAVLVDAAYTIHHLVYVVVPHSYAAWTTGDLLVEYMDTHDGKWPRGWDDLREATSFTNKGKLIYWDFTNLPGIVKIDWNARPDELARMALAEGPSSIKVVTQIDGSRLEAKWGEMTEPNQKVGRYLIQRFATNGAIKVNSTLK